LDDLLKEQLADLHDAENQLVEALPKMADAAGTQELKDAFKQHLEQTREHVQRLEQVFQKLGGMPQPKRCKAMEGLLKEGEEVLKQDGDQDVKDAALIASAQRVEHYEIAGYGCVRTYAEQLGNQEVGRLLQTTLDEEGQTDEKLTRIAETIVNRKAQQ
jgi:ferritin-like metal-binding protein YciE